MAFGNTHFPLIQNIQVNSIGLETLLNELFTDLFVEKVQNRVMKSSGYVGASHNVLSNAFTVRMVDAFSFLWTSYWNASNDISTVSSPYFLQC